MGDSKKSQIQYKSLRKWKMLQIGICLGSLKKSNFREFHEFLEKREFLKNRFQYKSLMKCEMDYKIRGKEHSKKSLISIQMLKEMENTSDRHLPRIVEKE